MSSPQSAACRRAPRLRTHRAPGPTASWEEESSTAGAAGAVAAGGGSAAGAGAGAGGSVARGGAPATGSGGALSKGAGGVTASGGTNGGSGGTTGAGGGTPGTVTILPANLIDDLEDGDGSISALGGRVGAWYTYNDKTAAGTQTPTVGDPFMPSAGGNGSTKAAQTSGSGFAEWGAGFGFDFNNSGSAKGIYPVTAFTGIVFSAKGTPFRLKVLTTGTVPTAEGGTCSTTKCGDNFGKPVAATATWQQFVVPFASLTQEGWGDKTTFDGATVTGVQFQVAANVTFDISVDDVGLY